MPENFFGHFVHKYERKVNYEYHQILRGKTVVDASYAMVRDPKEVIVAGNFLVEPWNLFLTKLFAYQSTFPVL